MCRYRCRMIYPRLSKFCAISAIDLTFVGGEVPLAMGIADAFRDARLNIIGPGKAAAQLEASKAFAKDFMARHGVPTAKYVVAHSPDFAVLELESRDFGGEEYAGRRKGRRACGRQGCRRRGEPPRGRRCDKPNVRNVSARPLRQRSCSRSA